MREVAITPGSTSLPCCNAGYIVDSWARDRALKERFRELRSSRLISVFKTRYSVPRERRMVASGILRSVYPCRHPHHAPEDLISAETNSLLRELRGEERNSRILQVAQRGARDPR
jgi:hypothetical protein